MNNICYGVNEDEERIKSAENNSLKIIKYQNTPELSEEQLKQMGGFSDKPKKRNKYRPSNKRKSSGGRKPVTIQKVTYPSMAAASEATGIPYTLISKFANGLITEKELLLRNAKRLQREESNKAYRESEEKIESLREN